MTADLIARARAGDSDAFGELVAPHRRELQVHCYRMLGSVADAEDAVQETLLAAWRGLGGFAERSSVRTWLYRIATRRCLNARRASSRRPQPAGPPPAGGPLPGVDLPEPTGRAEVVWLEPYPDALLAGLPDTTPGPDARYEATEAISLAFVTALQLLPPRQRAVLVLRDVLGYPAREVAGMLESTEESVTSALKRARAALRGRTGPAAARPLAGSPAERDLVDRLTAAFAAGDVAGLVALLADDVRLVMPPVPLEFTGRDLAARFHAVVTFREDRRYRAVPTRANGQPALGLYLAGPAGGWQPNALMVFTVLSTPDGPRVTTMTRFTPAHFPRFVLPPTPPT